ncbi:MULTISPECIES: hypothetical protein [Halolamina]|uniref:ABC-2 type transport system permease protein n=1 Tax=Halolamina pelagica TaxID=699431 RepID=A0A1I5U0V7_9EURY|nr:MULTISPECIES: hypothetical protein [Halolamina]NHX36740.1 hypothetical protein [Halolamina sp. R1-12]SFP88923.1 hypothetical protein SAMN05216277_11157 [Halolamina pelagica]
MSDADSTGGLGSVVAGTLSHGRTIAAVDVRRSLRKAVDSKSQLIVFVLFVGLFSLGTGYGSYLFGREVGLGAELPVDWSLIAIARGAFAILGLFLTVIVAVRTVGTRGTLENDVGLLSVVPTREAAVGMLLSESVLAGSYAVPLFVAAGVGYAAATGAWGLVLSLPVAAAVAVVAAVAVGYPLGLGIRHVATRIGIVARHRTVLILLAFVAYMALVTTGALGEFVLRVFEPMQQAPTGWVADIALAGTAAVAIDPVRAGGAIPLAAGLGVASAVVTTRIADAHWFADSVVTGSKDDESTSGDRFRAVEDAIAGVVGRPTAAVTVLAWKRAIRAPLKLLYVAYPLLFVVGFLTETIQTGEVPAIGAGFALVFVAWGGAVVFTLNPLGDQGAALPATVLSRIGGREFVGAHLLAGAIVAVPLGTVITAVVAVLSPLGPGLVTAVVLATPVSILVGSAFAVGVGMAFPRYEAVNITRSTKAIVPSLLAFAVFTAYIVAVVATGAIVSEPVVETVAAGILTWVLPFGISIDGAGLGFAARVALVPLGIAPFASAAYAVRRFERVTVD